MPTITISLEFDSKEHPDLVDWLASMPEAWRSVLITRVLEVYAQSGVDLDAMNRAIEGVREWLGRAAILGIDEGA